MQAALIAQWMQFDFIHGVMNTDNMSIAGETIDYGPCAFSVVLHVAHVGEYQVAPIAVDQLVEQAGAGLVCGDLGLQVGRAGMNVGTRIMGIVLTVIAFQMLTGGLKKLLPGLA